MDEFLRQNLLHIFTFYLTTVFVVSTFRRLRQYRDYAALAISMPGRWPRVMAEIRKHWLMFMTWATLRPAAVAIGLILIQLICSRLIWPQAHLTMREVLHVWWALLMIAIPGLLMLAVDLYFIVRVGQLDRKETEKYLDEAEYWLTSKKSIVVSVLTLGYINPRRMVDTEVRKAMEEGKGLMQLTLWLVSLQAGLRVLFGLSLWVVWATYPH